MNIKEHIERFNPDFKQGLSSEQVELRKKQKLFNKSTKAFGKSNIEIVISNIFNFFSILLYVIAGAMLYFSIKFNEPKIVFAIIFAVLVLGNTFIGIYSDLKARGVLRKLKLNTQATVTVIRNGKEETINIQDLVLDDVVLIDKNTQISADGIILNGELGIDESFITGESINIFKSVGQEVLAGTFVTSGKAYIKVNKVGLGIFTNSLQNKSNKFRRPLSEMAKSFKQLFLIIGIIVIAVLAFMVISFAIQGRFTNNDSLKSIAHSLMTMSPIVLCLLVSIVLISSVVRLSKENVEVLDNHSLEMLAKANIVCIDKTGTITDGTLTVKKVIPLKASYLDGYIAQAICNVIRATGDNSATAQALLNHFDLELSAGVNSILPFDSVNKYAGASFKGGKTFIIGAPEYMPISNQAGIIKRCEEFTKDGYRVVVLGEGNELIKDNKYPGMLEPVALIILKDHIRDGISQTIAWLKNNNVDVKVVSGDNVRIVSAVATEIGITNAHKSISLEGMPIGRVKMIANDYTVFGKATPEQKEALIIALRESKKNVTMIGDGINDILALKRSDCSISLADSADPTKNVSQIILGGSDFTCLPTIANEGRRVCNNLQRIAPLFIAKTIFVSMMALLFTMFSAIEGDLSLQDPFTINNLLLWEIVTGGLATLFLAFENNNDKLEGKFLPNVLRKAIPASIWLIGGVGLIFILFLLQRNGVLNVGIYTRECAIAMSIVVFNILSVVFLYKICSPLNKYRHIILICSASIIILALLITAIVSFVMNAIEPVFQIPYIEMDGVSLITTLIVTIVLAAIYLLVYQIISIVKKEDSKNED